MGKNSLNQSKQKVPENQSGTFGMRKFNMLDIIVEPDYYHTYKDSSHEWGETTVASPAVVQTNPTC